jgi:four helix bundle protein
MSLHHHSLVAWQRADDLFIRLHQVSLKGFPAYERFELGGQLRRAAFSVAANIVEGFAHSPGRTRLNFLKVSRASLAEVGYCIHVARRLGYLSEAVAKELEVQVKQVGAPLGGLIRSARQDLTAASRTASC